MTSLLHIRPENMPMTKGQVLALLALLAIGIWAILSRDPYDPTR